MSSAGREPAGRRDAVSRRAFLRAGGAGVMALTVAERAALAARRSSPEWRSCILLLMTGGPSQLDTFDPKPEAPADVRGPVRAISTALPGVAFAESLPLLAQRANEFSLIRTLAHDASPVHETGLQLVQTGRLARGGVRPPSFGSVVARALGPRGEAPPYVVLPRALGPTGIATWRGQGAGTLGDEFEPASPPHAPAPAPHDGRDSAADRDASADADSPADIVAAPVLSLELPAESPARREAYGETRFGRLCLQARQLLEAGARCVTVNLFDTLAGERTWDCHGHNPSSPATVYDYRDTLCPQFDRAVAALLDDLKARGLLDDTLVIATGEFGRTPRLNENAGRDHWPAAWSALVAGGGVEGGRVLGATDSIGAFPADRPVHPAELSAMVYRSLGIDAPETEVSTDGSVEGSQSAALMELMA